MEDTRRISLNAIADKAHNLAADVAGKIAASTIDDGLVKRIDGRPMLADCLGQVEDITPSGRFLTPTRATMLEEEVIGDTFFWAELESALREESESRSIEPVLRYVYDRADEGTVTVYAGRELTPDEWETVANRANLITG